MIVDWHFGLVDAEGNRLGPRRHQVQFLDLDLCVVRTGTLDSLDRLLDRGFHNHDRSRSDSLSPPHHVLGDFAFFDADNSLDSDSLLSKEDESEFCAHLPHKAYSSPEGDFIPDRGGGDFG